MFLSSSFKNSQQLLKSAFYPLLEEFFSSSSVVSLTSYSSIFFFFVGRGCWDGDLFPLLISRYESFLQHCPENSFLYHTPQMCLTFHICPFRFFLYSLPFLLYAFWGYFIYPATLVTFALWLITGFGQCETLEEIGEMEECVMREVISPPPAQLSYSNRDVPWYL